MKYGLRCFAMSLVITFFTCGQQVPWKEVLGKNAGCAAVSASGILYAATTDGLLRSIDTGSTWINLNLPDSNSKRLLLRGDSIVIAVTSSALCQSTNAGSSWRRFATSFGSANDAAFDLEGNLHAVAHDGKYARSTDLGATWIIRQTPFQYQFNVMTAANGDVFIGTVDSVYRSADSGVSWTRLTLPFDQQVRDMESGGDGTLYIEKTLYLLVSTDNGSSWVTAPINGLGKFNGLKNGGGNVMYANYNSIHRTTDRGYTWSPIGNLYPEIWAANANIILFSTNTRVYVSHPALPSLVLKNYFPSAVGNIWQFRLCSSNIDSYAYGLDTGIVSRDTIINQKRYFFYDNWLRYDENEGRVYCRYNYVDQPYLDFSLPPGLSFSKFYPPRLESYSANINFSTVSAFGANRSVYSIDYSFLVTVTHVNLYDRYAENIGPYYFDSQTSGIHYSSFSSSLLMAKIKDSAGVLREITLHKKPKIVVTPILRTSSQAFVMSAEISHPYSVVIANPGPGSVALNFLDTVRVESYYAKTDSIIKNSNKMLIVPQRPTTNIYLITMALNMTLIERGYNLYYRIVAKDKGIIQETAASPDTGYYELVYVPNGAEDVSRDIGDYSLDVYPNPCNPSASIRIVLPRESRVRITIYNSIGEQVAELLNDYLLAGSYILPLEGKMLPSGIYLCRMNAASLDGKQKYDITKKILLVK